VVANFGAAELGNKKWEDRSFFELLNQEKEFAKKTVDDLMQYPYAPAKRNPFHPIQQVRLRTRKRATAECDSCCFCCCCCCCCCSLL